MVFLIWISSSFIISWLWSCSYFNRNWIKTKKIIFRIQLESNDVFMTFWILNLFDQLQEIDFTPLAWNIFCKGFSRLYKIQFMNNAPQRCLCDIQYIFEYLACISGLIRSLSHLKLKQLEKVFSFHFDLFLSICNILIQNFCLNRT